MFNKYKKYLCIILSVLVLSLGAQAQSVPVSANEDVISFSFLEDNKDAFTNDKSSKAKWHPSHRYYYQPSANSTITFTIDVPFECYYTIKASGYAVGSENSLTIDGTKVFSKKKYLDGNSGYYDNLVVCDSIFLTKGEKTVTYKTTGSDLFKSLDFSPVSDTGLYVTEFSLDGYDSTRPFYGGKVTARCKLTKTHSNSYVPRLIVASYKGASLVSVRTASLTCEGGEFAYDLPSGTETTGICTLNVADEEYVKAFLWAENPNGNIIPLKKSIALYRDPFYDRIEGEGYGDFSDTCETVSGKDTLGRIESGGYAVYTLDISQDGAYELILNTETDGKMRLYIDDCQGYVEADFKGFEDTKAGKYYFTEGTHTIKIEAIDTLSIDKLSLYYTGGDTIDLDSLKNGGSYSIAEQEKESSVYKELWVSVSAQDGGNGTEQSPYRTIAEARDAVRLYSPDMTGNIIVNIASGRYVLDSTLTFTDADSGRNGYDIIYRATDPQNKPVIDGGIAVTGWTEGEDGIWSADADIEDMRNLYINGYSAQRARTEFLHDALYMYDDPDTAQKYDGYYVSKANFPTFKDSTQLETVHINKWSARRCVVKDIIDGGENRWIIRFEQPYYGYATTAPMVENTSPHKFSDFYIENAPELLDNMGEFYFDKSAKKVYYYPFPEEDMTNAEVFAGNVEGLVSVLGTTPQSRAQNIVFDGLDFRHGAWTEPSRTGVHSMQADGLFPMSEYTPVGSDLPYLNVMHAQITVKNADGIDFTNCNFINLGSSAISMSDDVHNSDIRGNLFRDISGTAVNIGRGNYPINSVYSDEICSRITVDNNLIRRTGLEYQFCPAIGIYYANSIAVTQNDIAYVPYTAISLGWGWDSDENSRNLKCCNHKIIGNRIAYNSQVCRDGGAIYTLGQMNDTVIAYNYLSDSQDFGGIYFDTGSRNISAHHNVVSNSRFAVFAGKYITDVYDIYTDFNDKTLPNLKGYKPAEQEQWRHTEINGWSDDAKDIINASGLSDKYKDLLDFTDYPQGRTDFLCSSRMSKYNGMTGIYVDATDYVSFTEKNSSVPTIYYSTHDGTVVGGIAPDEALTYEVNVPQDGYWDMSIMYSIISEKTVPELDIYIDNQLVIDGSAIPLKQYNFSDEAFERTTVGNIYLSNGEHKLKIKFTDCGTGNSDGLLLDDFKLEYTGASE